MTAANDNTAADAESPVLHLQIKTAGGAWRGVVSFTRDDEEAVAYAVASAPLLGRAGGEGSVLRITDGELHALATWSASTGWRQLGQTTAAGARS